MADQAAEGLLSPFLRRQRFKAVRPYLRGRVLDVGCGTGALAAFVSPDCYLGVEIDYDSLAKAREAYPRHRFESALSNSGERFDTVIALAVIEHVLDPAGFLRELATRLDSKADARILCTTPHPALDWVYNAGAAIGIFSKHANEEHEELLDRAKLAAVSEEAGLSMVLYKRFLFGANQIAAFQSKKGG